MKKWLDDFRRGGAELDEASKTRFRDVSLELDQLSKQYSRNVLDSTNAFEIVITEESKLDGLPEGARAAARQSARAKGIEGWRFTLQMPSQLAVMTHLEDRGVRQRMQHASSTIAASAPYDNRPIMSRILELRRERAKCSVIALLPTSLHSTAWQALERPSKPFSLDSTGKRARSTKRNRKSCSSSAAASKGRTLRL